MKNNTIQISFASFLMTLMLSCHDHDDFLSPQSEKTAVEFDSTQVVIHENEEQQIIRLSFDKPAAKNGLLVLSATNAIQSRFTVEPAITNGQIGINVTKDQQFAVLKLRPINNTLADGNLEFTIAILETSTNFIVGERKTLSIKVQDDESSTPVQKSIVNFVHSDKNVNENVAEGKTYPIQLSEALTSPGSIEISVESTQAVYGTHFKTIPNAIEGKIILNPAVGESISSLTIIPIDNSIITGELNIIFTITGTSGSIIKGAELSQSVSIMDDELTNKPKGYQSAGGGWGLKKIYTYDEMGRVKSVYVEKSSPATSAHTETYFYDAEGRIQKINTYPQIDIVYTWSNNRIIKSASIDNGIVKSYVEYDYDRDGNVSGAANFFKQQDGQFKLAFLNTYLYFLDGNLHLSHTYIQNESSEEYTLISTKTYNQYIDANNPFPMVEILPTVRTQTKLPSMYTVEENGMTLVYNFTYEFRADGVVSTRVAKSGNISETTFYLYY